MKYSFKYHGLIRNVAVFTVKTEDGRGLGQLGVDVGYHHFKVDEFFNVKKISYQDVDLAKCNTTERRSDGSVVPPRSYLTTEEQTKAFLETLIEKNIELEGIGKVSDKEFQIIKNYALELHFKGNRVSYKYYDGESLEFAINKARLNNPLCVDVHHYKGNMAGKLSI